MTQSELEQSSVEQSGAEHSSDEKSGVNQSTEKYNRTEQMSKGNLLGIQEKHRLCTLLHCLLDGRDGLDKVSI